MEKQTNLPKATEEKNHSKTIVILVVVIAGVLLLGTALFGIGAYVLFSKVSDSDFINDTLDATSDLNSLDYSDYVDTAITDEISDEQINCAIEILGETRVDEIIAGDTPTMSDIEMISPCFE